MKTKAVEIDASLPSKLPLVSLAISVPSKMHGVSTDITISTTTYSAELAHPVIFGMKTNTLFPIQMHGYGMHMGLTDTETTLTTDRKTLCTELSHFSERANTIKAKFIRLRPIPCLIEAENKKPDIKQ